MNPHNESKKQREVLSFKLRDLSALLESGDGCVVTWQGQARPAGPVEWGSRDPSHCPFQVAAEAQVKREMGQIGILG